MKIERLLIVVTGAVLLFVSSCISHTETPYIPIPEEFFDWKTTTPVTISVQVREISGSANSLYRTVNVFSTSAFSSKYLMSSGSALPSQPYTFTLETPTAYSQLFIEIIYPNGTKHRFVEKLEAGKSEITVSDLAPDTKSAPTAAEAISIPDWGTVPSTFDYTITAYSSITLLRNSTYLVPAGEAINAGGRINFWNYYGGTNAVLYVAGSLIINGASMNNVSIVVLPGGTLEVRGPLTASGTSTKPVLYVMEGGTLNVEADVNIGGANVVVNKGELNVKKNRNFTLNGPSSPVLYNSGTINAPEATINIDNKSRMESSGTITAETFSLTSSEGSSAINYGTLDVDNYNQTNFQATMTNYGTITSEDMMVQGTLDNYGYVEAGGKISTPEFLSDVLANNFTFINREGALFSVDEINMNNSTIQMEGNSIMTVNSVSNLSWDYHIENTTDEYALVIVYDNLCPLTWHNSSIDGKIEVYHQGLGSSGNIIEQDYVNGTNYTNGAYFISSEEERQVDIPVTDANKGIGYLGGSGGGGGGSDPTDNDGDGVTSDVDVDDNDPSIAYRSYFPDASTFGTIMIEDLWPATGDYDMNDLVCDYQITWTTNSSNKVVYMDYKWKLRAAGATKQIAMAIQLDQVYYNEISSVTSTHPLSGNVPFNAPAGLETYQTRAVIPLFNRPSEVLTGAPDTLVNTIPDYPYYTPTEYNARITFIQPRELVSVSYGTINPFIVATVFDNPQRVPEIHLPGYSLTSRAVAQETYIAGYTSTSDAFLSPTGMMWGIMVPISLDYPLESISIDSVYLHFRAWYLSHGLQYSDWYTNKSGYIDSSKLFPRQ